MMLLKYGDVLTVEGIEGELTFVGNNFFADEQGNRHHLTTQEKGFTFIRNDGHEGAARALAKTKNRVAMSKYTHPHFNGKPIMLGDVVTYQEFQCSQRSPNEIGEIATATVVGIMVDVPHMDQTAEPAYLLMDTPDGGAEVSISEQDARFCETDGWIIGHTPAACTPDA